MKKNLMTVAFFVASLAASAQTQNATTSHPVSPFPFQTDALKQAWINANPTDYEQMGGDKVATQTTAMPEFTNSEQKEAWLAQQQAEAVLEKAIPPTVITQVEKEAWLEAQRANEAQVELSAKLQYISENGIIIESVTP